VDNLWLTYHNFRALIAPFVQITYAAAVIFAAFVISRSSFFDHWERSRFHYVFFTVIAGALLWLLLDTHRQWYVRMCAAKRRVLDQQQPLETPNEEQRRVLDQVQVVPNWPWSPLMSLRVVAALSAPLVVTLVQNQKWAVDLWQEIAKLLGGG